MEKLRHKRFNAPTSADRSSQRQPALSQGNKEVHRRRKHPNLPSDSSSSVSGVAPKDSSSFKFGWRSSKQLFGTPIKKLLAEEMLGDTNSKRRAPGVIARLMGLDGMPLQHPANKQHKSSSEGHLQRRPQSEITQSGRSSRRSSRDQQEFKDVFEVSEIPKAESCRYPSQGADLIATDAEISFIEQKFMDAKRLATDRDSFSSKEFDDALEVLDSNTDLLLKYFQRPDSLFKKHLNDLQTAPLQSHCKYIEAMRSADMEKYEQHHDYSWRSARDTTRLNCNRSHQKRLDGYPAQFDRRHAVHSSPKSPKLQQCARGKQDAIPTKIIVLKPNLGKVQNATKFISSCSSHAFLTESGNSAAYPDVRNRGLELNKRNLPDPVGFSRQNSMESREIAKEITRRMKSSIHNGSTIFSSSRIRGYAGDDSSCDFSENESAEESEVRTATLANTVELGNHSRTSSRSSESSVSREAKKRLSERWKMTHKSQQVQAINRGSTLADMLAIPDKEMNAANFKSTSSGGGSYNKFATNSSPAGSAEPLGISSKDGWKDECIGSLSRSRSLPASSTRLGSPRTVHVDRFIMPKEALKRERRKTAKSFHQEQGLNTRNLKSGHKKSWSSHCTNMEIYDSSPDINTIQDKVNTKPEEDPPKIEVPSPDSLTEIPKDTSVIAEDVVDAALKNAAGCSESADPVLRELPSGITTTGNPSAVEEVNLLQKEPSVGSSSGSSVSSLPLVPELESSCCKDADQPSPVSVLDPSFTDDLSSCSECFESLSADLQGLRMQLQMLKLDKLESEEYGEGAMLISSDEDGGEAYLVGISEGNGLNGDSWESSYIIDVLSESGIDGTYPLAYSERWYSPECPVSPTLFDELEKRYSDCTACSRPERRMLFDRVNSGIIKIYKQSENDRPWLNPTLTNIVGCKLMKMGLKDDLCTLLRSQGKVKDDALGKVLVIESEWLDIRDDLDTIGREVERLLLDDLVAEVAGFVDVVYPK